MIDLLQEVFDPKSLLIEGIYNLTFEVIATFVTYKLIFKPMIKKQVKKELENGKQD